MTPPRMTREPRNPDAQVARAVVINASLAWTMLVGLLALGAFLVRIGFMIAATMGDFQQEQAAQGLRLNTLEQTIAQRRIDRDKQMEAEAKTREQADNLLSARVDSLDTRIRPLEQATASLAFIRDQIVTGFAEVSRRLDRIEGNSEP